MKRRDMVLWALIMSVVITACGSRSLSAGTSESSHVVGTTEESAAVQQDSVIEGVQTYPDKSEYHDHVTSLPEPSGTIPPVFGAHFNAWQNCGIYDQPVTLGNALHSMEHGAVWLTYSPDLNETQIAELQDLVHGHDFVLMSPYPPQTDPVVLTAWGVQLVINSMPDDRIMKFIDYYEQGPQNPEPGAPCSGAIGNPIQ